MFNIWNEIHRKKPQEFACLMVSSTDDFNLIYLYKLFLQVLAHLLQKIQAVDCRSLLRKLREHGQTAPFYGGVIETCCALRKANGMAWKLLLICVVRFQMKQSSHLVSGWHLVPIET